MNRDRYAWFAMDATRRGEPGERITLYKATPAGGMYHAHYSNHGEGWRIEPCPSTIVSAIRVNAWNRIKWPGNLPGAELERLAKGWAVTGGFSDTPDGALENAKYYAKLEIIKLEERIAKLADFIANG